MAKMKRCPMCYGRKTINVWEEVARDEISVTCEKREKTCPTCKGTSEVPMSNEDRIHAMIDEEFCSFIFAVSLCNFRPWCDFHCMKDDDYGCGKCIEKWLKQPAEEE